MFPEGCGIREAAASQDPYRWIRQHVKFGRWGIWGKLQHVRSLWWPRPQALTELVRLAACVGRGAGRVQRPAWSGLFCVDLPLPRVTPVLLVAPGMPRRLFLVMFVLLPPVQGIHAVLSTRFIFQPSWNYSYLFVAAGWKCKRRLSSLGFFFNTNDDNSKAKQN